MLVHQPRHRKQTHVTNTTNILPRLAYAICPKNYPSYNCQEECQYHLSYLLQRRQNPSFGHRIGVFAILA